MGYRLVTWVIWVKTDLILQVPVLQLLIYFTARVELQRRIGLVNSGHSVSIIH
jgi:hypothetical protein